MAGHQWERHQYYCTRPEENTIHTEEGRTEQRDRVQHFATRQKHALDPVLSTALTVTGKTCSRSATFFEEDGLSSNEFNQNSFLKNKCGRENGFRQYQRDHFFTPQQFSAAEPFTIFASGISQWDEKTQSLRLARNKIDANNTIIKKPSDLLLEPHFGCTDYSDPLRNSYSYRIRELSDNWVSLEDRHTLNLGGIPYGYYTIEVKAINSRGVSSVNMLTFHVKVVQPFTGPGGSLH